VLTKADKAKSAETAALVEELKEVMKQHTAAFPEIVLTSSHEGIGIPELRALVASVAKS